MDEFYHTGQRGTFSFDGYQDPGRRPNITDGNITALADFLAGFVYQSTIVTGNPSRTVFTNGFSFFGQDNFQITHRLNINLACVTTILVRFTTATMTCRPLSRVRPGMVVSERA